MELESRQLRCSTVGLSETEVAEYDDPIKIISIEKDKI